MRKLRLNNAIIYAQVFIYIYVLVRFLIVFGAFRQYHVNPWIFLAIDVVTAAPYAVGWPKLVVYMIKKDVARSATWGMVVAGSFAAPYLYIAFSAENLPRELIIGTIALIACSVILAVSKIIRKIQTLNPTRRSP